MQKFLEEHHTPVTVLLSADGRRERKGFLVDGHTPLYSIARIPRASIEGRASVNAYDFFERKLRDNMSKRLEKYVKANITETSIYSEESFWVDALRFAGTNHTPAVMALYYEIEFGLLHFMIGGQLSRITYNVVTDDCMLSNEENDVKNSNPNDILDEFFGPRQRRQLLAEHQSDVNMAPQPYAEIAAANAFLFDKKREVYALFKGRREVKLKANNGRYHLDTLIKYDNNGFCLRVLSEYHLHELIGIRYRNTVFSVNGKPFCHENKFLPTGTGV